jgi:predicted membrane GTPase involved in stress response
MNLLKANNMDNGHNKMKISKTIEKNGLTKRMEVEQVENGYIIRISKYGKSPMDEAYIDECKTYISTENPLEKKKENKEISLNDSILDSLNFSDVSFTDLN